MVHSDQALLSFFFPGIQLIENYFSMCKSLVAWILGRDWGRLKRRKVEIAFVNEKQNVHICGGNHTIILESKSIPDYNITNCKEIISTSSHRQPCKYHYMGQNIRIKNGHFNGNA